MKKILVIDNYDSFTYNLVHYIEGVVGYSIDVYRNDEIELTEVEKYDKILLSPGPGVPAESGICLELIKKYAATKSILGVCLGHQSIAEAFGGSLINLSEVYHGVATNVTKTADNNPVLAGLPGTFKAGRYHSWVVNTNDLPDDLEVTCTDSQGMIMAIKHKKYKVYGVQFHPESVLTEYGMKMIENWIKI